MRFKSVHKEDGEGKTVVYNPIHLKNGALANNMGRCEEYLSCLILPQRNPGHML